MEASRVPHAEPPQPTEAVAGSAVTRLIRRWADGLPQGQEGRRALALSAAERVDEVEERLGVVLARPLREHGLEPIARQVERNPVATLAGALVAGWLARRLFR